MSDEPRIYGRWAGKPSGTPEDVTRCIERVWRPGHPVSGQCTRKRGHGPDGLYCKQHVPKAEIEEPEDARTNEQKIEALQDELQTTISLLCFAALKEIASLQGRQSGDMPCPKCGSPLRFRTAASNGHFAIKCTRENCLTAME